MVTSKSVQKMLLLVATVLVTWILMVLVLQPQPVLESNTVKNEQSAVQEMKHSPTVIAAPDSQQETKQSQEKEVIEDTGRSGSSGFEITNLIQEDTQKQDEASNNHDVLPIEEGSDGYSESASLDTEIQQVLAEQASDFLQQKLEAEPYDTQWANAKKQQLSDLFVKLSPQGNELIDADCRSTFCRIDITHLNTESEQAFLVEMANSHRFIDDSEQGFYQRLVDVNGSIKTVFFQAREGYQLPAIPSDAGQ